ncbi:BAG family molecular chaperone regulator 4 [Iris pallida]|uniref:BAG family molecular chaperone regulator 4 n=1 Tax=Iris pallida TaxID=29817 RepID=A0AAX6EL15_IRIPA|nr:BAG family molecular chaperone regulator 4 [Iris pallida]
MRKSSPDSKKPASESEEAPRDLESMPGAGGMLVQRRGGGDGPVGPAGPAIKIKVLHNTSQHELSVPAQSTFGELKRVLAQVTGLEPQEQRLLFRGKEKENEECLHMAGVKDTSKLVLLEDPASRERKLEQMKRDQGISKACEAMVLVRSEVDKLAEKVTALESAVHAGMKVADKEFLVLTELLMVQLLKLDGIEAEGEAKVQRRIEVRRIQSYVDKLDTLKARNSKPFSNNSNAVSVVTQWETFDSGEGSLNPPRIPSTTKETNDWEQFD